jgi:hypothetical protein
MNKNGKTINFVLTACCLFVLAAVPVWAGGDEDWMSEGTGDAGKDVYSDTGKEVSDFESDLELVSRKTRKPWKLSISAGGGYDSNVLLLGDGLPLPVSITNKGAGYGRFTLDGSYEWRLTPDDHVVAGYSFLSKIYDNVHAADLNDHYWFGQYSHRIDEDSQATLLVSDEFQLADDQPFSNQVAVRPAISHNWKDCGFDFVTSELYYQYAWTEYYFPILANVFDRDSDTHTVGYTEYYRVPETEFRAWAGYSHTWNESDGLDFDYGQHSLQIGFRTPVVWEIEAKAFYTHTWNSYQNLNTLSPAGRLTKRRDDGDFFTVMLTRPINDMLSAYVRYDYNQNGSNIAFYQYDQHIWTAGIIADF